jgi:hypothetical protein
MPVEMCRPTKYWCCRSHADGAAGLRLYFTECEVALCQQKLTVKICMYCMLQQHTVLHRAGSCVVVSRSVVFVYCHNLV